MDEHPEEWRPVHGFEEEYKVSSLGRVWSAWTKKILRPATEPRGYQSVTLYARNGRRRCERVHRIVARAFLGEPPPGRPTVDHVNCLREDNRVANLRYASPAEQMKYARENGRMRPPRGEAHYMAKLTAEDVRRMRRLRRRGLSYKDVADWYPEVAYKTVYAACVGRSWRHVA